MISGRIIAPNDSQGVRVWQAQIEALKRAGYDHYEVSNYAKTGKRSRHNLGYWRMKPYIGCGPSAVSTLPSRHGPVRIENTRNLAVFAADSAGASMETISAKSFFIEHLMMGLRLSDGISVEHLSVVFGIDPLDPIRSTYRNWRNRGLIDLDGDFLRASEAGRMFLDSFLRETVAELADSSFEVVRWP